MTAPAASSLIETATFPKTVTVSGSISHEESGGNPNLCAVNEFKITVDDGDESTPVAEIGGKEWSRGADPMTNCPVTDTWSFPFTATAPGIYTVTAKGKHASGWGSDELEFEVAQVQEIIVTFPAAPSVAAQILADAEVPARYGSGKTGGNHIADVAAEMNKTKGTDFQGVAKKDVADYAAKVQDFLVTKGAIS